MGLNLNLLSKDAPISIETKSAGWLVVFWHDRFVDRYAGLDAYEISQLVGTLDLKAEGLSKAYLMIHNDCNNDFGTAKKLGMLKNIYKYEIDELDFDIALKFVTAAHFLECGAYGSY